MRRLPKRAFRRDHPRAMRRKNAARRWRSLARQGVKAAARVADALGATPALRPHWPEEISAKFNDLAYRSAKEMFEAYRG